MPKYYKHYYKRGYYYQIKYKKIDPEKIEKLAEQVLKQAIFDIDLKIMEDKKEIFWYGGVSSKKNLILKNLKVMPPKIGSPRFEIQFTIINKANVPYSLDLQSLRFWKNGKEFPVIFTIDTTNNEILGVYVLNGDCERVVGNKVIVPPNGECGIKYTNLKILGIADLTDGILMIDNFSIPLRMTNKYEEMISKEVY